MTSKSSRWPPTRAPRRRLKLMYWRWIASHGIDRAQRGTDYQGGLTCRQSLERETSRRSRNGVVSWKWKNAKVQNDTACLGLLDVNVSEFFTTQFSNKRRGHRYKLYVSTCKSSVRYRPNCFSHRVIRVWNILPDCVNFTTDNDFKHSLTTSALNKFCKLFFM